ncbi:hypothetical protein TRVA0_020S00870 [Trichomonascus vanleenenianus]|uniref:uncharacterized protein n=1 Tax=Trichomonascus vanleenenianus TaxID=2268995 RepID=UPI003ECA42AC
MVDDNRPKLPQRMQAQTSSRLGTTWKNNYPRNPQKQPGFPMNQEHHLHYSAIDYPQYNICYSIKHYLTSFPAKFRYNQLEFATFLQDQFNELPLTSLNQLIQTHLREACRLLTTASTKTTAITTATTTTDANANEETSTPLVSTDLPEWQLTLIDHIENYQFNVIFLGTLQTINGYMALHCIPFNIYLIMVHALLNYALKLLTKPDEIKFHIHTALWPILCQCPETWISFLNGQFPDLKLEFLNLRDMTALIEKFDNHIRNSSGVNSSHMQFLDLDTLMDFPTATRLNCDDQQHGGGFNLEPYNRAMSNTDQLTGQALLAHHLGTSKFINNVTHITELVKLMKAEVIVKSKTSSANNQQSIFSLQFPLQILWQY